jgi:hypothetical protein
MCAEKTKENGCDTESKGFDCCSESFAEMFEKMSGVCGCGDKMHDCSEKMKSMMSKCCGSQAERVS